jgi:hypothetical protein
VPLQLRRRLQAQAPFLIVLLLVVGVFVYLTIEPGHWRRGTSALALAMLLAAALRVLVPSQRAGMLAVRGRWWDTLCYLALGVLILIVDIRLQN